MVYEAVIGLEVHAELNTETKMYCSCKNEFGGEINTRICPVCTGHPGTLPVINRNAVKKAIMAGRMMNCTIAEKTMQYRKHYRYPDLPKGYQISQLSIPLCSNGYFDYFCGDELKRALIRQIHIEEDAGKLIHCGADTVVDYNRCGVPLIEIVTEPCFGSSDEAFYFLEAVRTMLLDIGISDCRMEEGSLRADVNVSLRKKGDTGLNSRVEMKNLATFSGARRAIDYEVARQKEILENGGIVSPMTMRWDDEKGKSFFMRDKESMADYRFMPEPDIPSLVIEQDETLLPESESERRIRLSRSLPVGQAKELAKSLSLCRYFDTVSSLGAPSKDVANFMLGIVAKLTNESHVPVWESNLTEEKFCEIISRLNSGEITGDGAKLLVEKLFYSQEKVDDLISELNLRVCNNTEEYRKTAIVVLLNNEKAVSDYKAGKESVIGFLIGQCMRSFGKGADANIFREILTEVLKCQ